MITLQTIKINSPEYDLFVKICEESFPAFEREDPKCYFKTPPSFINETCGVYCDGQMVGYLFAWKGEKVAYILELAITAEMRCQGIGTQVLQQFKERYGNRCVVFCCEQPDPQADNAVQRQRRYDLYCRNGYIDTGIVLPLYGIKFVFMSSDKNVPKAELKQMLVELSQAFPLSNFGTISF